MLKPPLVAPPERQRAPPLHDGAQLQPQKEPKLSQLPTETLLPGSGRQGRRRQPCGVGMMPVHVLAVSPRVLAPSALQPLRSNATHATWN
jgi:hypothetical protein